ncbi:MAG: SGNH/GDSL hydrolase family protein [Gammaproteobacteria bacterium]|nr:SGNH/GDSL hydrolase family protein [Gammaproteobacteria bacterium]
MAEAAKVDTEPTGLGMLASRQRPFGVALTVLGVLGLTVGVGAEHLLGVGTPGLGLAQIMAILLGVAVTAQGIGLISDEADHLARWKVALDGITRASLLRYSVVAVQLALFVLVARAFRIENPAFYEQIVPLTVFGFIIHHALPLPYRLPFFASLCVAGAVLVLGITNALWLLLIVLAFIGICHLPVPFRLRIALVVAVAIGLALVRNRTVPWSGAIWPILGSMLMFRLVVYLYDLRHGQGPTRWSQTLAYFLLLPNLIFPLFPVVDFATFKRSYYDRDPYTIYQRGLDWILRGTVHLIAYRLVYQHLTIAPYEVDSVGHLTQYVVTTFLLYLRVSGQFHLVIGMLHLFGFHLPETNHLFYLASSFTDFWRRINIYWKDFMMKLVFYPLYLPLRKRRGSTAALVLSTMAVFLVTWAGHSYQWFWIRGTWFFSWTDALFWSILAALLLVNSLYESRRGRQRLVAKTSLAWRELALVGLRAAGTFSIIALLWSFWNSPTWADWLDLIAVPAPRWQEAMLPVGILALIGIGAMIAALAESRRRLKTRAAAIAPVMQLRTATVTLVSFAVLYAAVRPALLRQFNESVQEFVREIRLPNLNERDQDLLTRGYYENLMGADVQNAQLAALFAERPTGGASIWNTGVLRETNDFLYRQMRPLFGTYHRGLTFRTNRWGMRDKDYDLVSAPNTYRIALLGQSYVAGDGVSDGETFEAIIEQRLNDEWAPDGESLEILNFAVGSYSALQQISILDRVFSFRPQALYFVANPGDGRRASLHLVDRIRQGVEPPFAYLQALLDSTGITASTREIEALRRLKPHENKMLAWAFRQIADACKARGILPVWIYLSIPENGPSDETIQDQVDLASSAGFEIIDLSKVYDHHDLASLQVSPWDFHPNAAGHRLIADRLYDRMTSVPTFGIGGSGAQ